MKASFKSLKAYEITFLTIVWIKDKLATQGIYLSKSQVLNLAVNQLKNQLKNQLTQSLPKKNSTEDEHN